MRHRLTLAAVAAVAAAALTPAGSASAAPAAAPTALAAAASTGSGTLWLGMQPVTVTATAPRGTGTPRACVTNHGPHAIETTGLYVLDGGRTITSAKGRYLRAGARQCITWGTVRTAHARFSVGAVDQTSGIPGNTVVRFRATGRAHRPAQPRHLQPVTPFYITAAVQRAAGGLRVDGDYGPLTDGRLRFIRAHARSMPSTVARVQRALGVGADGVWGPRTDDAFMLLHNAAYGRYHQSR
jgi:hypothetical protein